MPFDISLEVILVFVLHFVYLFILRQSHYAEKSVLKLPISPRLALNTSDSNTRIIVSSITSGYLHFTFSFFYRNSHNQLFHSFCFLFEIGSLCSPGQLGACFIEKAGRIFTRSTWLCLRAEVNMCITKPANSCLIGQITSFKHYFSVLLE